MNKRNLKSLALNKKSISNFNYEQTLTGGRDTFHYMCASFSCRISICETRCDTMCQ